MSYTRSPPHLRNTSVVFEWDDDIQLPYIKLVAQTCGVAHPAATSTSAYQFIFPSVAHIAPYSACFNHERQIFLHLKAVRIAASKHSKTLRLQGFSHLFVNITQARHDPRNRRQLESSIDQATDYTRWTTYCTGITTMASLSEDAALAVIDVQEDFCPPV